MNDTMTEHRLEVICRTLEDQRKLAREGVIPDYIPEDTKTRILAGPWKSKGAFEVFTPPRAMRWAVQNKHFPVMYI